jgi:predicted nucleic acid-binding protein
MALGTLVDSNVLLDVFTNDPRWSGWSAEHLANAFDAGSVVINPLIFAELSVGFDRIEDLDEALPARIEREDLPWEAAFLAGRCFLQYRRSGGAGRSPLPDFYIAAHAATTGRALLTRDRPRYLHLLPTLEVISPD